MDDNKIRIVIADDHPIFRNGVIKTVSELPDCEVVAECGNGEEALAAVREHLPDIVLLDISMPGNGIQTARRIADACPDVQILMLTVSEDESDVMEALEAGARGYVLKGAGGEELAGIIRDVHDGGVHVSPNLAARMLVDIKSKKKDDWSDAFSNLTQREEAVLKLVAQGMSNKEIARELSLSDKTVKHHVTNVLQKLQVRNRVEAALKARDHYTGGLPAAPASDRN